MNKHALNQTPNEMNECNDVVIVPLFCSTDTDNSHRTHLQHQQCNLMN